MIHRKHLIALGVVLFFAHPAFAQFGQSNRLVNSAERLSRDAEAFADASYNGYTNTFGINRTEIEAMMLAHQFAGASRIFYRMVVDRRRDSDLRDAYSLLVELARSVDRNNTQRSSWNTVQQSMSDLARDLDYNDSSGGNRAPEPRRGGGRMTWRGRVDDDVRITIRGGTADLQTLGGTPYNNGQPNFSASLPARRVNVTLNVKKGRGEVFIEQQPSRDNDFAVVIRIKDTKGGASDYEFEITW
jgi:hypothetical protein